MILKLKGSQLLSLNPSTRLYIYIYKNKEIYYESYKEVLIQKCFMINILFRNAITFYPVPFLVETQSFILKY